MLPLQEMLAAHAKSLQGIREAFPGQLTAAAPAWLWASPVLFPCWIHVAKGRGMEK